MGDGLGVVPPHTYARLRFDEAAEQAVQHLSNVLQWHRGSPYEGQFVSQMEPRAGTYFRHRFKTRGILRGFALPGSSMGREKKPYG